MYTVYYIEDIIFKNICFMLYIHTICHINYAFKFHLAFLVLTKLTYTHKEITQ